MLKDAHITIKVERELRDLFAATAARRHRTMSQMLRELMWAAIEDADDADDADDAEEVLAKTDPREWRSLDDLRRHVRK